MAWTSSSDAHRASRLAVPLGAVADDAAAIAGVTRERSDISDVGGAEEASAAGAMVPGRNRGTDVEPAAQVMGGDGRTDSL